MKSTVDDVVLKGGFLFVGEGTDHANFDGRAPSLTKILSFKDLRKSYSKVKQAHRRSLCDSDVGISDVMITK